MRLLLAAALLTASPHLVTPQEYAAAQPGQTKAHVQQHTLNSHGQRIVLWVGVHGWTHLLKGYPTSTGDWAQLTYMHGPRTVTWRLTSKAWCPSLSPCTNPAPEA